ncbi:MAG TPA: glyoxalase [Micromonosporaceae bacterium]|nr:glyoxalase [Micromonosporaceae bacterium]
MTGTLHGVIFDTADIKGLASFYSQLTGFKEDYVDDYWITLKSDEGRRLAFQLAPDHVQPRWPDQRFPQQFHLDFLTPDMEGETARAISLGATRLEGGGDTWTVLADPSGHPFCVCANDGATSLAWQDVAIDCPDGKALGTFYAELLGYELTYEGPEGAMISAEGRLPVMFQNVADYNAPRWPDPAYPQQAHLDIDVDDIDEAEEMVLGLGATKLRGGGGSISGYRVFADPAGHPFCLVWGQ